LEQAWLKYDVKKIFSDGDDIVVFNNVVARPATLIASGLYYVKIRKYVLSINFMTHDPSFGREIRY
jgi:hypothetical protein